MGLGKNIRDAFEVVTETYENVYKLMDYCRVEARKEDAEFKLASPKILHSQIKNEDSDWCLYNFILVFQNSKDKLLPNEWRDGPVYVMEINFYPIGNEEPLLTIAKFEYVDGEIKNNWQKGCSQKDFSGFLDPLYDGTFEYEEKDWGYSRKVIDEKGADSDYWGLRKIAGAKIQLVEITRENASEKIFGGFHSLIDK